MPTFEGEKVEESTQGTVFPGEAVGGDSGAMAFLNRGIAQLFGLPGDLVNMANEHIMDPAYRAVGLPGTTELPIGSRAIESGMAATGAATPEEDERADSFGDVAMREIGAGVASLLPFGAAARSAQTAVQAGRAGPVRRTLGEAHETMGRRPKSTTAVEGASIGGAGAGAGAGQAVGEGSDHERALEITGALVGGLSPAGLAIMPSTVKAGVKAGRRAIDPFTREGARLRAAKRAQDLAADPDAAARALDEGDVLPETEGMVPPAQRTEEPRLVALQRALTDDDPELEQTLSRRSQAAGETARRAGEQMGGAPAESARQFLAARRNKAVERFRQKAGNAVARAQERLARVDPDASPEQQSRIVRDELETAHKSAQSEEGRLWGEVPRETTVPTSQTRRTFEAIRSEQGKLSDPEDVPPIIRDEIDKVEADEPINELQTLRSRLLRAAREERAKDAPNREKLANLARMQEAVLDDMSRAEGGEALNTALAFSRVLNERFRQGPVGRVLGFERRGGPSVPAGETIARTVGRGREAGGESADAIRRALGEGSDDDAANAAMNRVLQATRSEEGQAAIGRFLEANFRLQAVNPDGSISPSAARQFLKRNREVLERLPDVRQRLELATEAQRGAERAIRQSERLTQALQQRSKSRLALYLDSRPEKAMQRVIDSEDPKDAARSLLNAARKDPTGMAEKGLKDEFVQTLMRNAETGAVDETGQRMISGRRMRRLMDHPQAQKVAQELLGSDERKRLRQIANTFSRVEAGAGRVPNIGRPMEDLAANMLEIPGRIVGAQVGGKMGSASAGGSLQTAQILSGRVKQYLRRAFSDKAREVLTDAVQDDALFRTLLLQPTERRKAEQIHQRLNAWLGAPVSGEDREQQAQQ